MKSVAECLQTLFLATGYVPYHPGPPWDAAHEALNSMTQRRNKEFPSMTIYFVLF